LTISISKIFKPLHPPDVLDMLGPEAHLGPVDPLTMPEVDDTPTDEEARIAEARKGLPDVEEMLLLNDFEEWAQKVLSGTGWAYYRSAGESLGARSAL
jgi:L-lactate dehydrogenase (cytochrome)